MKSALIQPADSVDLLFDQTYHTYLDAAPFRHPEPA
jgi:hypothetical protein